MASLSLAASASPSTSFQQLVPDIKLEIIKLAVQSQTRGGIKTDWKLLRSLSLVDKELRSLASRILFRVSFPKVL
jgi:hypothetical protein